MNCCCKGDKGDIENSITASQFAQLPTWQLQIRHNHDFKNTNGLSNKITTTKYTWYTWLPVSIFAQFRRIANCYFLFMGILMLIGTYAPQLWQTPFNPWGTLFTLLFVLLVTSFKEGYEDLQRSKSDKFENTRRVKIVTFDENGNPTETVTDYEYIKAGDIIKLEGKQSVPADMLILLTSNYHDGNQCYIETANIDGETNLKLREAPSRLMTLPAVKNGTPDLKLFSGEIEFEQPNKNIHNFTGLLKLNGLDEMALSADNIMLRSALFSNTDWAYGIAIYTGQETKIQMNNRSISFKTSKLEGYLNNAVIIVFSGQVLLCVMSIISIYILGWQFTSSLPYVYPPNSGVEGTGSLLPLWLEMFFTFLILYSNFLSITIYVTIEMVNVGQSFFIISDLEIYEESLDVACSVKASNLVQELGMVSSVFSDKTGTLTRNEMKFVKFILDGVMYDVPYSTRPGPVEPLLVQQKEKVMKVLSAAGDNKQDSLMYQFLFCLASCHTVVRESDGTYRAESPDELALVQGVDPFGCGIDQRGTSSMIVQMIQDKIHVEVLAVNAFNSDRKRMSILLKVPRDDRPEGYEYLLLCKGADNIMLPLCDVSSTELKSIDKSLLDLANMGLRTLCVAQRVLDEHTVKQWLTRYSAAGNKLAGRAEALAAVGGELEINMKLLGITAIEDRLQDEVPEVIADLAKAGIIVWMLTGDKEETAINIGRSCNLILEKTHLFFLVKIENAEIYSRELLKIYKDILAHTNQGESKKYINDDGEEIEIGLVMDGPSFKFFNEDNQDQRTALFKIGQATRSVIGCRLTPVQKQQVVALAKTESKRKLTCLSIGDGANDVSMIREADVGVGIFGKEGRQAANNADFAIGQFKFLRRLLLIHGRFNYIRQSKVFLYSMHKNMVVVYTLYWFNYYAYLSGSTMYDTWIITAYNFVLGLPIIFFGFFDKDITDDFALSYPQVYSTGRENKFLSLTNIIGWVVNAMAYGAVICSVYFIASWDTFVPIYPVLGMGTLIFTGTCLSLQLKVGFLHHSWNWIEKTAMAISVLGMFLYFIVLSASILQYDLYWVSMWLYAEGFYWFFGAFTVPIIAILIDMSIYYSIEFFRPTQEMLYQECSRYRTEFDTNMLTNRK